MTHKINGLQVLVLLAKESLESGNLAGSAAEEHFLAILQEFLGNCITVANIALYIFAATQSFYVVCVVDADVLNLPVAVECCAKDNASVVYCLLGKQGEDAARGTLLPDSIVAICCRVCGNRMLCGLLVYHWANLVAQSAVAALLCVNDWVGETLLVALHCDALSGTALCAGAAAAAVVLVGNSNHLLKDCCATNSLPVQCAVC